MLGLADGQPLVLTQLDGDGLQVVLDDGDLPEEELELPAELRMTSTLYPRSSRKTLQLLGVDEGNIPVRGQLRDVWGAVQGHAAAQASALRQMFIGQRLVELVWGELVVRRGVVQKLSLRVRSEGVIHYEFEFHVVEADEALVITRPFDERPPEKWDLFDALEAAGDAAEEALKVAALLGTLKNLAEG